MGLIATEARSDCGAAFEIYGQKRTRSESIPYHLARALTDLSAMQQCIGAMQKERIAPGNYPPTCAFIEPTNATALRNYLSWPF